MVDGVLACLKATALDRLIDCSPYHLRNPDVHLPVTPLTAGFPEALNPLDPFHVRHGTPPHRTCDSYEKCPILSWLWSRASRIRSQ